MAERLRVVQDTGIILQAVLHPAGPSGQALRLLERQEIEGFISGPVRQEYAEVLHRPAVRTKNPHLTAAHHRISS